MGTAALLWTSVVVLRRASFTRRDLAQQGALGLLAHVVFLGGLSGAALLDRRWQPGIDVLSILCIQVTVAAVVFVASAAAVGQLTIPLDPSVVGALAWLLLLYLTPPVTTLWAWAMFHDVPTIDQWVGLSLGAIGVALAWPRTGPRPNGSPPAEAGGEHGIGPSQMWSHPGADSRR